MRYDYDIFDAHAHVYPNKIADRAVKAIGEFYDIPIQKNGTVEGLVEAWTDENGEKVAKKCLIHATATTPHQVKSINDFISGIVKNNKDFVGFGTLHTELTEEETFAEAQRMLDIGLKGVKLHPDFQKFNADCEAAKKMYRATEGRLPILFHAGDRRYGYSAPERIAAVAKAFPKQTVIAAHFGGYSEWEKVVDVYKGIDNVYFDTCSTLFALTPEKAKSIIDALGSERFLFGTDYPMWDPLEELGRFMRLPLSEKERVEILGKNAEELLGIKL